MPLPRPPGIGITVRRATSEEFDEVGEITVRAYRQVHEQLGDYELELRDVAERAASAEVLVADIDGRIAGTVTWVPGPGAYAEGPDRDAGWIRMLAVGPDFQRQGIGETLVRACLDRARRDRRSRILLHTTAAMRTAHRLYERLGFRRATELDWEAEPGFWLRAYAYDLEPELITR